MKKIIIIGGIVVFLLIATGLVVFGAPGSTGSPAAAKTDPGIVACQQMAERQTKGTQSGTMTEAGYVKALEPYEASAHADLKTAGVNFVTAAWESQKALESDETPLATSFGILSKIHTTYAMLQTACANHGVTLKPLAT